MIIKEHNKEQSTLITIKTGDFQLHVDASNSLRIFANVSENTVAFEGECFLFTLLGEEQGEPIVAYNNLQLPVEDGVEMLFKVGGTIVRITSGSEILE